MGSRKLKGSVNKGGRPRGISGNQTNLLILNKIAKERVQTYQELMQGEFAGWHRWSLRRRLNRMTREGLLKVIRSDQGQVLGWSLNPNHRSKTFSLSSKLRDEAKRAPVYKTAFSHDFTLRQIKQTFQESSALLSWTPEYLLKAKIMRELQHTSLKERQKTLLCVPDALLSLKTRDGKVLAALELELTQKSRRRLYQKIESYFLTDEFDCALFIVQGESLVRVIEEVRSRVLSQSARVQIAQRHNEIYVTTLDGFQQYGLKAKVSGNSASSCLNDLLV